jgi:VIT1/CCC1 family predicted Fe2+/Mn2+ transporter
VPVSTISSEYAFSTSGRIIEERRRRLSLEMVEALTCTKDWEAAENRLHEQVEDKELKADFADMFLDVHSDPID